MSYTQVRNEIPSNIDNDEFLPHLSNKLLQSLYNIENPSVLQLKQLRKSLLLEIQHQTSSQDTNNEFSFKIDDFISSLMSFEEINRSKRIYKTYLQEVANIQNANELREQHLAKSIYDCTTKYFDNKLKCLDVLKSFIGSLTMDQLDVLRKLCNELHTYHKQHLSLNLIPIEYGDNEAYHTPEKSIISTISQNIRLNFNLSTTKQLKVKSITQNDKNDSLITSSSSSISKSSSNEWLSKLCTSYLQSNPIGNTVFESASQLSTQILKVYEESNNNEETLQILLFDFIGVDGFEFMMEIIQNKDKLQQIINKTTIVTSNSELVLKENSDNNDERISEINYNKKKHVITDESVNQRKKRELKELKDLEEAIEISKQTTHQDMRVQGGIQLSSNTNATYGSTDWLKQLGFDEEYLASERSLGLQKGLLYTPSDFANPDLWLESLAPAGTTEIYEKRGLPPGTQRSTGNGYDEFFLPAIKPSLHSKTSSNADNSTVRIEQLDAWIQPVFQGTKQLNPMQSKVYRSAYHSIENLLICAPTGAGKTNVAMLTLLQLIKSHRNNDTGIIDKAAIKAVYIAPMKALAQEVVAKFSDRLKILGLIVREFTGDMQLTKQEILDSQLLVCTPEKYDVVTRKGGDGSLGTMVSLVIIDEVHLLADERGAVIETIVARTQRYVESSQKIVRIVGLSATLPNYKDVSKFLHVNSKTGLFYFGSEYRPVPLDQTFLGVTEKQKVKCNQMMNLFAYQKMKDALMKGKQVMIFVHARKETVKTAEAMLDLSSKFCTYDLLENCNHEKYTIWKRQVDKSRSKEVQQLFSKGIGIHHAGMLRADRTMTEQLFECGLLKVLCCTATLAWGVNLPAHTVIIKGTELYDPERGGFVDLSMLDVLQIFGRAGRPQYDNTGHAILITPHKSLASYLSKLTQQAPIESSLVKSLPDHLNAEIVNGTVNNIKEACSWLAYTFLFVRMCKNPLAYDIGYEDLYSDPQLENKRFELIRSASEILDSCMMIRYDRRSGNLSVTNLGRIASHYYIKHDTIEAFNRMLAPHLSDPDALHVLCSSSEFDQLKVRPEELPEIDTLKKKMNVSIRGSTDDTSSKVNILLQGYLNKTVISSFTLQSDTNYVAQNASRITRALFEICLKRGWSNIANQYLNLCKCIDRRMLADQTPLRQFDELPKEILQKIEDSNATADILYDMDSKEIGQLIRNQKYGSKVLSLVQHLPYLHIDTIVQPITRGILRLLLSIQVDFVWHERYHGTVEAFWIWIEDGDNEYIYHSEHILISKREINNTREIEVTIPIREPLPSQYYIRVVSDRWVGCERIFEVTFKNLILPIMEPTHTDLLPIHPIPCQALNNPLFESLYNQKFSHFNPIQSQMFHVLYHTDRNVLVGAPTGSGKTITGELAMLRLFNVHPKGKIIYVAPLKALAKERLLDWQKKLGTSIHKGGLGKRILELTGDITPSMEELNHADILIVTPEKWDSISRGWQKRNYVQQVQLVIIDEIHLLGVDRGPVLEVIVSRMRFISTQTARPIRFVGLSTALANPKDLADWLGIGKIGIYNFRSAVRPIPLTTHIQGFPGQHYCPRMATMNKPAYAAILEHSPTKPVLIFVSSRRQTRLTALDLIACCASDDNPKKFLHMSEEDIEYISATLQDRALKDTIVFGVALHHAGMHSKDRNTVEELFSSGKIQVLVCTSTLAWGVNLPCHLVIIKGTEYFDGKQSRYIDMPVTDVLQMMGRAGRPQFDDSGVACIFVHEPKKTFYKKFLHEPFPVESSLHLQLHDHFNAEIASGTLTNIRDCIEYLTWTYYFRRLLVNPTYYNLTIKDTEDEIVSSCDTLSSEIIEKHLMILITKVIDDLKNANCIIIDNDEINCNFNSVQTTSSIDNKKEYNTFVQSSTNISFSPSYLGKVAAVYYLHYQSVYMFYKELAVIHGEDFSIDSKLTYEGDNLVQYRLWQLLLLLCSALEFSELPVRHNEEYVNEELAHTIATQLNIHSTSIITSSSSSKNSIQPKQSHINKQLVSAVTQQVLGLVDYLSSQRCSYQSPHTKAFLLLVAHMKHVSLPMADYVNDTKTVLDQVNRVLNSMIDIAGEEGYLGIVIYLANLSQYISKGISETRKNDLNQLPYMNNNIISGLAKNNIYKLKDLLQFNIKLSSDHRNLEHLLNDINNNHTSLENNDKLQFHQVSKMIQSICDLPMIEIISVRSKKQPNNDDISSEWQVLENEIIKQPQCNQQVKQEKQLKLLSKSNNNHHITSFNIELNIDYELECQIKCLNNKYNYSKHKDNDLSWWVILGIPISSKYNINQQQVINNDKLLNKIHSNHTYDNSIMMNESYINGELLVLKRIGILASNKVTTISLAFKISSILYEHNCVGINHLLLYITCNSINGIDIILKIPITIQSNNT